MVVEQLVSPELHWNLEGPLQAQAAKDMVDSFETLTDAMKKAVEENRIVPPLSPPASVEGYVTAQVIASAQNLVGDLREEMPFPDDVSEEELLETMKEIQRQQDTARRTFESGAVRSPAADHVRYDLISPIALRALAETYAEGALKYGDNNWLKGFPAHDVLNHALNHLELWKLGDKSEPHLAHAMWNIATLIHFEATRPDLFNDMPYWKTYGPDGIQCQSVCEGHNETKDQVV